MKHATLLVVIAALALLSACETVEGLGRDTQKLGNNITGAAQNTK